MNHTGIIVDVDQVLQNISQTLAELKSGIQSAKLSRAEAAELNAGFEKVELQARKCKMGVSIDNLMTSNPDLSTRDAVVQLLSDLPNDLPASMLSELAGYAVAEWEKMAVEAEA